VPLRYLAVRVPDGFTVVSTVKLPGAEPVDKIAALQAVAGAINEVQRYDRGRDLDVDRGQKRRCYPHVFFRSPAWGPPGRSENDWELVGPSPNPLDVSEAEAGAAGWDAELNEFAPGRFGALEARLDLVPPEGITPERRERDRRRITGHTGPWRKKKKAGCQEGLIDHNNDEVGV
jgi:hypothetical protein